MPCMEALLNKRNEKCNIYMYDKNMANTNIGWFG